MNGYSTYAEPANCAECQTPIIRRRPGALGRIYCDACLAGRRQLSNKLSRVRRVGKIAERGKTFAPDSPMKPPDPRDPLMLLIRAGWGNVAPQGRIPEDVRAAAEAGRMPRRNGASL